jgi:CRP-like cAMP-binding protein
MSFQPPRQSITEWNAAHATQTLNTWRRLLPLGPTRRYRENVVLFAQGDPPREVFLIVTGIVKLTCDLPNGQESLLMLRYPGQFAEECTYDLQLPYPVTGTTITPCELHRLDLARMLEAEQKNPEVNAFENFVLKRDLYKVCMINIELKTLDSMDLLERALWEIATVQAGGKPKTPAEVALPLDNKEMAEWLGMSESHYKQTRTGLEEAGRLRRKDGKHLILLQDFPFFVGDE